MRFFKVTILFIMVLFMFSFVTAGDSKKIKYKKTIQIVLNTSSTGANMKSDLNNLPVLIKLDATNFDFNAIKGELAGDMAFATSDGSLLTYKIKSFDKPNKMLLSI